MSPAMPPAPPPALLGRLADLLPWPLLVLEPDARLVYANQAGRELLARARPLRCNRLGRVEPALPAQRAAFQLALAKAGAGAAAPLLLPGRPQPHRGRLSRLPGEGPALLLLSLSLPAGGSADGWPAV